MPKIGTNWNKLEPGDVISFRYQSVDKSKPPRTNTILVLNTKYQKKLKSGKTGYYLNGLKLEESNISIFTNKEDAWNLLTEVGWVSIRSLKNELYKIDIAGRYIGTYGATDSLYNKIQSTPAGKKAEYRTYDWDQVRKSSVYYEPIKLPKDKILLLEKQRAEDEN
tara:strand:+ start:176 stop:670 length:495 start_codon:yes stop_codon:yes gene_type:complete